MKREPQRKTVAINRGLFLVRYTAASDLARLPKVTVAPGCASTKDIIVLLHPDHNEAVLWQPDSCLLVRAMAAGELCVQVEPAQEGGSTSATVKIEPLNQGEVSPPLMRTEKQNSSRSDLGSIRILGHVAGIGDVLVNANEWIAGPSTPSRIEGISVDWPGKPPNVEMHYAVKTAKPQTTSGRKMGLGSFSGTRGKGMPIVGIMLELSGPEAASFELLLEAIFLGSPRKCMTGKRVVGVGPTGREPLVGLRVAVKDIVAPPEEKPLARRAGRSENRVRVFQSHTKQNRLPLV